RAEPSRVQSYTLVEEFHSPLRMPRPNCVSRRMPFSPVPTHTVLQRDFWQESSAIAPTARDAASSVIGSQKLFGDTVPCQTPPPAEPIHTSPRGLAGFATTTLMRPVTGTRWLESIVWPSLIRSGPRGTQVFPAWAAGASASRAKQKRDGTTFRGFIAGSRTGREPATMASP